MPHESGPDDIPSGPPNPPPRGLPDPDPSLRNVTRGVSHDDAISAPLPEVRATAEAKVVDRFDKTGVTHVVMQVSIKRQVDIFRSVGYKYDWNIPFPFWHFLGKATAKAVFGTDVDDEGVPPPPVLEVLTFVELGRREFVALTTPLWRNAVEAGKVVEVEFKKTTAGEPLEVFWGPARARVTAHNY